MLASYHIHSLWSDGKSTVAELVEEARAAGLPEIGISDHLALHPSGRTPRWSIDPRRTGEYAAEVLSFAGRKDVRVRLGLEMDWFEGREGPIRETLERFQFEYAIGSVHYIDPGHPNIDADPVFWGRMPQEELDEALRRYWLLVRGMAESRLFRIAAHLDLPKKFGYRSSADLSPLIEEAVEAVAKAGMAVEVNTSGRHKACAEMYPSMGILRACRKRGIPVVLSSDAHLPGHLVRDFGLACGLLAEAGYTEVARLGEQGFIATPLARIEEGLKGLRLH